MPRLILQLGSGARTADIRASALSDPAVTDAVEAAQANAVIANVDQLDTDTRRRLSELPGVEAVFDDIQAIPQVADPDEVEDFLNRVRDLRGEENAPPTIETKPTRQGDPIPDGGASVLPVPSGEQGPVPQAQGPIANANNSLEWVGVPALHDQGIRGEDVISVVIDTGACNEAIPEERQLSGDDLTGEDDPWMLLSEHGGMSMGLMAGGGSTPGIDEGVLPDSQVYPIKTTLAASELIQAQDIIAQLAADNPDKMVVVNNSWGFPECTGICQHPVTNAIDNTATEPRIIQVFAAGNEASGIGGCGEACDGSAIGISGPNSLSSVITVAATGRNGQPEVIQDYSSRGGQGSVSCGESKPDVGAPVFGEMPFGCGARDMGNGGGTSAASPIVAGIVGLVSESRGQISADEARAALRNGAVEIDPEGFDGCTGAGVADASASVDAPTTGGPTQAGLSDTSKIVGLGVAAGLVGAVARNALN